MTSKLYHECYTHVCQARSLLQDLLELGFNTIVPAVATHSADNVPAGLAFEPPTPMMESLSELQAEVEQCRACLLHEQRNTVVFGRGNPSADLVFVGEAPGYEEDQQGLPFVGEAGQLLKRILFAMGLSPEDVYICNLIKCRPPVNRDPLTNEVAACEPYLKRQPALLKPKVIVALGRFASQTLLGVETPISRLRGHWYTYAGSALMPTFHPAYLLRSPAEKKLVWEDMKEVKKRLESAKIRQAD
ncbi:MAG: uracil-DNA glycosylase [Desulfuromonadales bacterium]|nr:uracil-DNA glycosylase [Desulfuromonadales bacterium]